MMTSVHTINLACDIREHSNVLYLLMAKEISRLWHSFFDTGFCRTFESCRERKA